MAAFAVPAVGEPFEFRRPDGKKTYRVPRMVDLPMDEFVETMEGIKAADGDNVKVVGIVRGVFEHLAPGSTEGLSFAQMGALSDAWATDSVDEAGEDGSSSD